MLTLAKNELKGSHSFLISKFIEFHRDSQEHLHNFKTILLVMHDYHKAAFALKVSLLPHMMPDDCLNVAHSSMNIIGIIDLHSSLQILSIRILWQLRTVKGILVLNTTQGKKNVVHLLKRH